MANKKLFPNAQALPPKAPKIKSNKWKKSAAAPAPIETPADVATTTAAAETIADEPVVETIATEPIIETIVVEPVDEAIAVETIVEAMPAAEASKAKPKPATKTKKAKKVRGEAAVGTPAKGKKAGKAMVGKPKKDGMSMTQAAKQVLMENGEPMSCRDMIDAMSKAGYWKSPGGLTPHNTLYSAILRLIQRDGKSAAFRKTERGLFTLNASAQG